MRARMRESRAIPHRDTMESPAPPSATAAADLATGPVSTNDSRDGRMADARSRRNAVTSITGLVGVAVMWGVAETARAAQFPERHTKAVIAAVVAVAACVQIVLGLMITVLPAGHRTAGATVTLKRVHRRVGAVTLLGGGFVTYLCMTGPFPGGPTLHRVVGFCVCAVVLVKIPVVVNLTHRRILITTLGLLLALGFITAFLTNGLDVLTGWS